MSEDYVTKYEDGIDFEPAEDLEYVYDDRDISAETDDW